MSPRTRKTNKTQTENKKKYNQKHLSNRTAPSFVDISRKHTKHRLKTKGSTNRSTSLTKQHQALWISLFVTTNKETNLQKHILKQTNKQTNKQTKNQKKKKKPNPKQKHLSNRTTLNFMDIKGLVTMNKEMNKT